MGARWLFVFDDGVRDRSTRVEADERILARCKALVHAQRREYQLRTSRAARRWRCCEAPPFYRDALFHAEYGDDDQLGRV